MAKKLKHQESGAPENVTNERSEEIKHEVKSENAHMEDRENQQNNQNNHHQKKQRKFGKQKQN